jgi:hypothetical protein
MWEMEVPDRRMSGTVRIGRWVEKSKRRTGIERSKLKWPNGPRKEVEEDAWEKKEMKIH